MCLILGILEMAQMGEARLLPTTAFVIAGLLDILTAKTELAPNQQEGV